MCRAKPPDSLALNSLRCVCYPLLHLLLPPRLWDARSEFCDLGFVAHHEGSVECLAFHPVSLTSEPPTHLVSGGADGDLVIWSAGTRWEALKTLKAHKGGCTSVAVHPSGKLALSCGRDRGLRLWDLVKGRCTYKTKMAQEGQCLAFVGASGGSYTCVSGSHVACFDLATGELSSTMTHASRLLCSATSLHGGALVTGGEGKEVCAWDVRSGKRLLAIPDAHTTRIRGIAVPWTQLDGGGAAHAEVGPTTLPLLIATAGSDGHIKLWDTRHSAAPLSSVDTRARLTCLVACPPGIAGKQKGAGPSRRVAVVTRPDEAPTHTAADDREKGTAWWERGEHGPKMSALLAQRQVEKEEKRRRALGINVKELKAKQQQQQQAGGAHEGGGKRGHGGDNEERQHSKAPWTGGGGGQNHGKQDKNKSLKQKMRRPGGGV